MAGKRKEDSLTIENKLKAALVPEADQPYPIPENWVWTRLGAISLDPQYGWTTSAASAGDVRLLRTTDITSGQIDWSSVPFCKEIPAYLKKYLVWDGDIVISRAGSVGFSHLIKKPEKAVFASYLIRFKPLIVQEYLAHFLKSQTYWDAISESSAGIAIPNVNASKLKQISIPIAPLPEQQRIAEKLESLLGKIKEAKALLDEIPEILQNFRQTVLSAACSGRLTEDWRKENSDIKSAGELLKRKKNSISKAYLKEVPSVSELINDDLPSKWAFATLPYLVSNKKYSIKRGPFGSSLRKEYFVESGYKVYEQQHAIKNDFTLGTYYITGDKFSELKAFELNEGDLIMSCSGTIGRLAVVPHTFEKGIINQALLKLTLDNEVILTDFSLFMFKDYLTKQEFASLTKGNAITNIASVTELKKIYFPLPPLPEQEEIVRLVDSLFSKADALEARYKEAMEQIESLPEIILSKAFRGELVPQDPNDGPAIKLLEKVLKEKESVKVSGETIIKGAWSS